MRLSTACDQCKARKVRCDGASPCSHCKRRNNETCKYAPAAKRPRLETFGPPQSTLSGVIDPPVVRDRQSRSIQVNPAPQAQGQRAESNIDEDETFVPRDSRLLEDAQGKLMFVGDCAPLSFLQTVRHLFTTLVDTNAFVSQIGHDALLEQSDCPLIEYSQSDVLIDPLPQSILEPAISTFLATTSGLLDIGGADKLHDQIKRWSYLEHKPNHAFSAVNSLVLAIGLQSSHDMLANNYFQRARNIALTHLTSDTSPLTVQAFLLVAVYMLRGCQLNGAFLYFGLAARASYSIGMHRAEVNARFGDVAQKERERLFKSLKVVDLFISISLGRPPALYDLDCTVAYKTSQATTEGETDLLDDVLQILLVVETMAEEIYDWQRKMSLQLTKEISHRLKNWAAQRMRRLNALLIPNRPDFDLAKASGACQALSTYYYAIMFLSKPFLMYEAYHVLEQQENPSPKPAKPGRRTLAEGCVDAACCLVEMVYNLTQNNCVPQKMPVVVSWLFTSSLVLGVALVGGFGRIMEKYLIDSISALEYFSKHDAQAMQYSLIAKSLLSTSLGHIQRRELHERLVKGKASAELFGLRLGSYRRFETVRHEENSQRETTTDGFAPQSMSGVTSSDTPYLFTTPNWEDFDLGVFGDLSNDASQDLFGTLNLFPMFDANTDYDASGVT